MCEKNNHEYADKTCPNCGQVFCYSCCGSTNVDQGGKYQADYMTCPKCGQDYYDDRMEGKTMYFTTWGPVRGCCGHNHKTKAAAKKCLDKDRQGCAAQGGFSDRGLRSCTFAYDIKDFNVQTGPGHICPEED